MTEQAPEWLRSKNIYMIKDDGHDRPASFLLAVKNSADDSEKRLFEENINRLFKPVSKLLYPNMKSPYYKWTGEVVDGGESREDAIERFRERRKARLDARMDADEDDDGGGGHGNTKIPFGLCQREGIKIQPNWTPTDAWKALEGKGYNASEAYKELKETGHVSKKEPPKPEKVSGAREPVSKKRVNSRISEIVSSGKSYEEQLEEVKNEISKLPVGTKITAPESWADDDGKVPVYTFDGQRWTPQSKWSISIEDMASYLCTDDESERPKITSVARDPESIEASRKKRESEKHYAMNPDGSINGKHALDFHNTHVSQEERDDFSKSIKDVAMAERGWDEGRSFYGKEANNVGEKVLEEIKRRAALRKKDKENMPIDSRPQVEDIYDALKDCRDFGPPDGFSPQVDSDIDAKRTEEIVKEALSRFPTDWFKDAKYKPVIYVVDGVGRPHCVNGRFITVYTNRQLGDITVEQSDRGLVNDLAHELGHYMEYANKKVGDSVKDCLWRRGAGTEVVEVEPGYRGYKDSFFSTYMGKIYPDGGTEILSVLIENIGKFGPMDILDGKEYDFMRSKYGRKKTDPESLAYILGVLAAL